MSVFNKSEEIEISIFVVISVVGFMLIFLMGFFLKKHADDRKFEIYVDENIQTLKRFSTVNVIQIPENDRNEKSANRSSYIHCTSPTFERQEHFDLENQYINPAFKFSFD